VTVNNLTFTNCLLNVNGHAGSSGGAFEVQEGGVLTASDSGHDDGDRLYNQREYLPCFRRVGQSTEARSHRASHRRMTNVGKACNPRTTIER
jgi:hypothetical protein